MVVFDLQLIEEAAILTGVGLATAFGLLVILMIITSVTGVLSARLFDRGRYEQAPTSEELDTERRDKALAAVIAVTAIIENPDILNESRIEIE